MTEPSAKKPHSHSSLGTFRQCEHRYHEVRVLKNFTDSTNEAAEFGSEQHDLAENALEQENHLEGEMGVALEFVRKFTGLKAAERELGITKKLEPTGFYDDDCWFRGKIDVTVLNGDKAIIIDYKTGKRRLPYGVKGAFKPDEGQMMAYALMTFLHHPEIQNIDAYLYWTHANHAPDRYRYSRQLDGARMVEYIRRDPKRIEKREKSGQWEIKPSGLCNGWCPVETCKYWGNFRRQY